MARCAAQGRIPRAVLADTNERLIRAYRGVQRDPEGVIRAMGAYVYEEEAYYAARAAPPDGGTDTEIAAWFTYINKAGFNGLWRVNRHGACNVPFGRHANPTICDWWRIPPEYSWIQTVARAALRPIAAPTPQAARAAVVDEHIRTAYRVRG